MIMLSFNIRGIGVASKSRALRRLFENIKLDLILVQEMMCLGVKACEDFLKIFHSWEVCAMDVDGFSRGLLAIWNPLVA